VLKSHGKIVLRTAINEAMDTIAMGDVYAAWKLLRDAEPRTTAPKPKRLLTDLSFFDTWEDDHYGVEVPYRILQRHTGGIKRGNLWYMAARPGNGKSAHLCNIATKAVLDGHRVKFYSLEMSEMEVRARFHAALASHFKVPNINVQDIRDRRVDMHEYKTFISELEDRLDGVLDIHTPKDGPVSPGIVAVGAEEYSLNIVDYVGLMRTDTGSASVDDWRMAAQISNRLKEIALASSTGVLAAAQINRDGEVGGLPPKVKNLAQSDALGQDADVVVTLRSAPHNVATLFSLEKNRHGCSGIPFYTTFEPNEGIYRPIDRDEVEGLIQDAEVRA
jgi:replicative DNA helicase